MNVWSQQAFDLESLGLEVDPTPAMLDGDQGIAQHSWCGTVIVWPKQFGKPGQCPVCGPEHASDSWWEQTIDSGGLAGLRLIDPSSAPAHHS